MLSVKNGTKVEQVESDVSFQNSNGSTTYVPAGSTVLTSEDGKTVHVVPGDVYDSLFVQNADKPAASEAPPKK